MNTTPPQRESNGSDESRNSSPYDAILDSYVPGASSVHGWARWKLIATCIAVSLAVAFATSFFAFGFNVLTLKPVAEKQKESEKEIDLEKVPFTTSASWQKFEEADLGNPIYVVFGELLTENEQRRISEIDFNVPNWKSRLWAVLNEMGTPPNFSAPYGMSLQENIGRAIVGMETRVRHIAVSEYTLTLFSDRQAGLTINELRATDIKCAPSEAKAVFHINPQGVESTSNAILDLAHSDKPGILMVQEEADFAKGEKAPQMFPFFEKNHIVLGNGATPGVLNISTIVGNDTCEWKMEAAWRDGSGKAEIEEIMEDGHPFRMVGPPRQPKQEFELTIANDGSRVLECEGELQFALPCTIAQPKTRFPEL